MRTSRLFACCLTILVAAEGQAQSVVVPPASPSAAPDARAAPVPPLRAIEGAMVVSIDSIAKEMVAKGHTAGLALAIVQDGRIVMNRGYGSANLEHQVAVLPTTVFSIFSITKIFTASAVLQLAERGQLKLDDPLTKYFPSFPRGDTVTIRHLLNHTSGLADYAVPGSALERMGAPPRQLAQIIMKQEPVYLFEPGTKWGYSNSNYALLGNIIEQVSAKSYSQYMAAEVFARAGMSRTAIDHNSDIVPMRATGYMLQGGRPGDFMNGIYVDMNTTYAAGAMRSTAEDIAKGFLAIFSGHLITAKSLEEMLAPARVKDGRLAGDVLHGREDRPGSFGYYGLGIDGYEVCGRRSFGGGGAFPSFSSAARNYSDEGLIIVVVANTGRVAYEVEAKISRMLLSCAAVN